MVGLQRTYYSAIEGQGSVELCTVVISGNISGGDVELSYFTTSGLAEGDLCDIVVYTDEYYGHILSPL